MKKMEPIVKEWYDYLKAGKVRGMKCTRCGAVEFPPVPVCNSCGNMDMEWTDMDGEGELLSLSFSPMGVPNYSKTPNVTGYAKLKEGMYFCTIIEGLGIADMPALLERIKNGPVKVELYSAQISEQYNFPYFRLK